MDRVWSHYNTNRAANEVTIVHQGQVGSVQATFIGSACSH